MRRWLLVAKRAALLFPLGWVVVGGVLSAEESGPAPVNVEPGSSSYDEELIQAAGAIVANASEIDRIWPGHWSSDRAFVLYRYGQGALLISPEFPPAPFVPVAGTALPERLKGLAYLYPGALPGLETNYEIDYRIGSITAPVVVWHDAGPGPVLSTLFHEAFHGYQGHRFARTRGETKRSALAEGFVDSRLIAAPEFRALAEVERRMLRVALRLPPRHLRSILRHYLAVRWKRTRAVPEQVRREERQVERKEGSAEYVGEMAASLITQNPSRIERRLDVLLGFPLESLSGGLPERLIHLRVYGTGAALGLLLDRLGVEWKERMEQGATFDDLVGRAVGFDPTTAPELAALALERFDYPKLLAQASQWSLKDTFYRLETFYALAPVRLVLEDPKPLGEKLSFVDLNFESGNQGYFRPEPGIMLLPDAKLVSTTLPWGSFVVRNRPVLNDMREAPKVAVTVLLAEMPRINGKLLENGEYRFTHLDIDSQGVELSVDAPILVRVSNDSMILKIQSDQ